MMTRSFSALIASLLFAACTDTEVVIEDHYGECTSDDQCPGASECLDGICYERVLEGCPAVACPEDSECRDGVCYKEVTVIVEVPPPDEVCGIAFEQGLLPVFQMPGDLVPILALRFHKTGDCSPDLTEIWFEILVTRRDAFVPSVDMYINDVPTGNFLQTFGGPIGTSEWYYMSFEWENIEPVSEDETITLYCDNCDADMPPAVSIHTSWTGSYGFREDPSSPTQYSNSNPELDQLTTFPE